MPHALKTVKNKNSKKGWREGGTSLKGKCDLNIFFFHIFVFAFNLLKSNNRNIVEFRYQFDNPRFCFVVFRNKFVKKEAFPFSNNAATLQMTAEKRWNEI